MAQGSVLVLCMLTAHSILDMSIQEADWLICLGRGVTDVFMQDAGDQDLMGQVFLGGLP